MEESLQRDTSNDKEYSGARLLGPSKKLKGGYVGLSFQLKMLKSMNSKRLL